MAEFDVIHLISLTSLTSLAPQTLFSSHHRHPQSQKDGLILRRDARLAYGLDRKAAPVLRSDGSSRRTRQCLAEGWAILDTRSVGYLRILTRPSPGVEGTFHVVDPHTVWYEDLTGSGT